MRSDLSSLSGISSLDFLQRFGVGENVTFDGAYARPVSGRDNSSSGTLLAISWLTRSFNKYMYVT